jgi:hypothetical protein
MARVFEARDRVPSPGRPAAASASRHEPKKRANVLRDGAPPLEAARQRSYDVAVYGGPVLLARLERVVVTGNQH